MTDFIKYYENLTVSRKRQSLASIVKTAHFVDKEDSREACKFLTHDGDYDSVLNLQFLRYGTQIVNRGAESKNEFSADSYAQDQFYTSPMIANGLQSRPGEREKFGLGMYETVVTGVGQTILNTVACLFTSWEQIFQFMSGEKPADKVETLISMHRDRGAFQIALQACDFVSSGVDSCILHMFLKGDWLSYSVVWPSDVKIVFGDSIVTPCMTGLDTDRPVDQTDIEDASAVIIQTGAYSDSEKSYVAYIGATTDDEYPMGRMVTYHASEYWPIPEIGESRIDHEFEFEGFVANPMTVIAKQNLGIGAGNEYPVAIIRGDARFGAEECLPTTDYFYKGSREIEVAWSLIMRQGLKSARGTHAITLAALADRLPASLDVLVLTPGSTYEYIPGNGAGVLAGIETISAITRGFGASKGVPPYVMVGPVMSTVESGIALVMRTQPLIDNRNKRAQMNMAQVTRVYDIESALLATLDPTGFSSFFKGVKHRWIPGEYHIPEGQMEQLDNLIKARQADFINQAEAVRRYSRLPTVQDAIDQIDEYAKVDPDYRDLSKPTTEPADNQDDNHQGGNPFAKDEQQ